MRVVAVSACLEGCGNQCLSCGLWQSVLVLRVVAISACHAGCGSRCLSWGLWQSVLIMRIMAVIAFHAGCGSRCPPCQPDFFLKAPIDVGLEFLRVSGILLHHLLYCSIQFYENDTTATSLWQIWPPSFFGILPHFRQWSLLALRWILISCVHFTCVIYKDVILRCYSHMCVFHSWGGIEGWLGTKITTSTSAVLSDYSLLTVCLFVCLQFLHLINACHFIMVLIAPSSMLFKRFELGYQGMAIFHYYWFYYIYL